MVINCGCDFVSSAHASTVCTQQHFNTGEMRKNFAYEHIKTFIFLLLF